MKNYMYKHQIGEGLQHREVSEDKYTERQKEHKEFIDMLSAVVKKANCGWDEVKYKLIEYDDVFNTKLMAMNIIYRDIEKTQTSKKMLDAYIKEQTVYEDLAFYFIKRYFVLIYINVRGV